LILESKLDINYIYKSKETLINHSEEIKAKLQKWKSHYAEVVAKNNHNFLTQKIEPIDNSQNNHTEEIVENQISTSIEINKIENKDNEIIEFKQKCVNDINTVTLIDSEEIVKNLVSTSIDINKIDNKDNKIIEFKETQVNDVNTVTLIDSSNSTNIKLPEYSVDHSNNENAKNNNNCLKIVVEKSDEEEYKIDLINKASESENVIVKDIKINSHFPKTKKDSIKIGSCFIPKNRKYVIVETNLEDIKQRLKILNSMIFEKHKIKTRFYATIDPSKNLQAENELTREISKDMFSRVSKHIMFYYF